MKLPFGGMLALLLLSACGVVGEANDAAPVHYDSAPAVDARDVDAALATPDAGISTTDDAAPSPRPGLSMPSGSATMSGGALTLELQLGHPLSTGPATAGGLRLEARTTLEP